MHPVKFVLVALLLAALAVPGGARAATQSRESRIELAERVEQRAAVTSFPELEAFGEAALARPTREGLNRLYHVAWISLNQGDFERAAAWNDRLAEAARVQDDARYQGIARLNALAIRYDSGDSGAAAEMHRIARTATDWFVKVHAMRLSALALMDQDHIGDGLRLLTEADAVIPENAPYADTARAGLWEVTGMGLMKLNDIEGATTAFRRFEIDYSNPAYPRPDFDALYNLTRLSVQVGDQDLADRLYAAHHRLSRRANLESLLVYDANLCAMVAEGRGDSRAVLDCLSPYGADLGAASFLAPQLLPTRALAYARTGQVRLARRDLAEIRRREAAGLFREDGFSEVPKVEAALLFTEGRTREAFQQLDAYHKAREVQTARRFSAGIGQVTREMQEQLAQRRRQLDTARANTQLQKDVIGWQRWMVGIAVVFILTAAGLLVWQWRSAGHLRLARRAAEEASRSKSDFLANMSHEIRTPLNGVVAMADALARSDLGPREREMVDIVRSSSGTLERLLSDILDSAKIESGQITIEPAPFHLGDLVRETAALWESKAAAKGVALEVGMEDGIETRVYGDGVRVRQVLTNLISNALKFTATGSVSLRVESLADDRVRFTVVDTGVGFEPDQKARIFGRFHQADGSITRRFGGTGLGLAISRELAELMGGSLDCDSQPGVGSRFWFEIPLPPADVASGDAATLPDADLEAAALRILLADDHPANRKVIEILLSGSGAELVCAADGREAVEAYQNGGFDLVLMDMQMPVMDGLTATARIRAFEAQRGWPRTPVLMLTANAMAEHVEAGRRAGADGHLSKPVTAATLFAAISHALATAAPTADAEAA
ncbi:ATP-binding protein [Brevundimonas sp.]|uniref:hybrid sensor histidine kinase/response regulator n=1 Tax=Brevundimonas sp. TaxID=1871086 RepID=UPI0027380021|nr:ATP-binding protein [Brevundimonas sp.]MDP3803200.1 ATP-binding protein [Brevundimonas sp.]